jgi:hypothetical protein
LFFKSLIYILDLAFFYSLKSCFFSIAYKDLVNESDHSAKNDYIYTQ